MNENLIETDNESIELDSIELPDSLPVIPLSEFIIYPLMVLPMFVTSKESLAAARKSSKEEKLVLMLGESGERNPRKSKNLEDDFYEIGTPANIIKEHQLNDGKLRIIIQGLTRVRVNKVSRKGDLITAVTEKIVQPVPRSKEAEITAWIRNMRDSLDKAITLGKSISPDILIFASNVQDPGRLADLSAATMELDIEDQQSILNEIHPLKRLKRVFKLYANELEVLDMQQKISNSAKGEMEKSHKEYFLRQQIKAIQQELGDIGDGDDEITELAIRLRKAKMPEEALTEALRQLEKLERMHSDAAEASVIRNYLDVMLDLPWAKSTKDRLNLKKAKEILDEDHYDLEKVKERILEHLGVMKLKKGNIKGPILCFVGPPGVGKTSLGRSIARALGRKFIRLSLGGVRDEAEIRGHRRTYVGALPGRVIQGISQMKTNNPVFMMDEVDKIGSDFRGDPSSALLEVLDPEQNTTFRDNYLGVDFDLSKVMFILTANRLDTIQPAFRDRMEIIELSGYTEEDKIQIARKYLISKQRKQAGITANQLSFDDSSLKTLIKSYTSEAGVRSLEREIASICRKIARKVAEGQRGKNTITSKEIPDLLGPPKVLPNQMLEENTVGVATGLAWTGAGGDVLFIETIVMEGKGNLTLTGQLGEVMQESAKASLSYIKANSEKLCCKSYKFAEKDLHVHVPEGAIPKDGPSAGVSMSTSMVSAFTGIPVRKDIAMTGEITLRGRVMAIGGVKEKVLAAKRIGINEIIIPKQNEKDLSEIQEDLRKGIKIHLVSTLEEVLELAIPDLHSIKKGK